MQQQDNHEYPFLYQRQTCHQVQPNQATYQKRQKCQPATYLQRSEERFSRNAETDIVCRLLLEKKKIYGYLLRNLKRIFQAEKLALTLCVHKSFERYFSDAAVCYAK